MMRKLLPQLRPWAPWALQIGLGVIFLFHGSQKLFGLFGGHGVEGTAGFFDKIGLSPSYPMALAVSLTEFLGGLLVLVGLFARPAALALAVVMVGAIVTVHGKAGFSLQSGGFEYNFALIAMSLGLAMSGAGECSLDALLFRRRPDAA